MSERYRNGVQIGVDQTDHVAFFCPDCDGVMRVTGVRTLRVIVDARDAARPKYDKCTWVEVRCKGCGATGQRKFYWTTEDGKECTDRTDTGAQD